MIGILRSVVSASAGNICGNCFSLVKTQSHWSTFQAEGLAVYQGIRLLVAAPGVFAREQNQFKIPARAGGPIINCFTVKNSRADHFPGRG